MSDVFRSIPFVTTAWLADNLATVKVVDGSWHLPPTGRSGAKEFAEAHVPGAVFFDLDKLSDAQSPFPHMLPDADMFGSALSAMGLSNDDTIIVYDQSGLFTAPRVAWMLKIYGARDVRILEGGLPRWRSEGRPVTAETPAPAPGRFDAALAGDTVADLAAVAAHLRNGAAQVVDARPRARFLGEAPEPRPGVPSGHMPGAISLPFDVVTSNGCLKPAEEIRAAMEQAGIDLAKPIVTTCGSGVSAVIIAMALAEAGAEVEAIYDGSWAEWATTEGMAVARGRT